MVSSTPAAAADPAVAARWRARLDALTHWCLSELPLTPALARAVASTRATLGDLLRRALGRDGVGVVDLLDALDAPSNPAARALVGRVLGADLLLVVVTARGGTLVRADARACRAPDEARALVDAYLGAAAPDWVATFGAAVAAGMRAPALARGRHGETIDATLAAASGQLADAEEVTVVLPFLALTSTPAAAVEDELEEVTPRDVDQDRAAPEAPAALEPMAPIGLPAVLGGMLRPGAAFLDAPAPADVDEEDEATDGDATDEDAHDAETTDHPAADQDASDEDDDEDDDDEDDDDALARPDAAARRPSVGDDTAGEADGDPGPDLGGALDRLRARTSAANDRVSMLIATDDGVAEHVADAAGWLADASVQELRALARAGWAGDAAVDVALTLAEDDPEALDVVQVARRHEAELVVEIDGRAAAAWLAKHRPEVVGTLAGQR